MSKWGNCLGNLFNFIVLIFSLSKCIFLRELLINRKELQCYLM